MTKLEVSLRQLQYIVAVAEHGGFRRAADACQVAQPSLSMQVALAERQLGVQIFERDHRSVRLTSAGAAIVGHARRVLVAAHDLHELARQSADPFTGTLRLGVIPTVGPYLLPEITPALAAAFPRLQFLWTEARTDDFLRQLADGGMDAALLALEAGIGDLEHRPLAQDSFVLAASSRHPLVKPSSPAAPEVLNGVEVLVLDDGHCFREQALSFCTKSGAAEHSFRATSMATLVQMVSAGTAVTLLPALALPVENRRAQLRVRQFTAPAPSRTLVLAWRRGSALSQPLTTLADTIRAAMHVRPATTPRAPNRVTRGAARGSDRSGSPDARG